MPSFKTAPELDSSTRGPYDDLNRLERNGDRAPERNSNGNGAAERNLARQLDRADDRNPADLRAQDRLERVLERNGKELERELDRNTDRHLDRESEREPEVAAAAPKAIPQARKVAEPTHPLIEGLFSKLPQPEVEWPLAARQKWLQTAASIFDLMYAPNNTDGGELSIRVERTPAR